MRRWHSRGVEPRRKKLGCKQSSVVARRMQTDPLTFNLRKE